MRCLIELHKEFGLPPTSKRKAHAIGIGTEEADIDHVRRLAAQQGPRQMSYFGQMSVNALPPLGSRRASS